jgi:hypothetical protein
VDLEFEAGEPFDVYFLFVVVDRFELYDGFFEDLIV